MAANPAYLYTSAEAYDSVNVRFTDVSGNNQNGGLTAGTVTVGSATGNGAVISVPYVGGTTATKIVWPAGSIPATFTICSITRYPGGTLRRIFDGLGYNWLHGHWSGYAGSTHYNGPGNLQYSISPNTNWVVVCGRNTGTAGAASTIVNDVVTSTSAGGQGNLQLTINAGTHSGESSDWQLAKLYVWNSHLSNELFAAASSELNGYLSGAGKMSSASCVSCPANSNSPLASQAFTACTCNAGFTGPDGGTCTACTAGKYKIAAGSAACSDCAVGTYSTTPGATLATTCLACPANSNSPISSSALAACTCNAGFTRPDVWTVCASEGQECSCPSGIVRFGANNIYAGYKEVVTSISCTNAVFGDPVPGIGKSCECNSNVCSTCTTGKYKITTGSAACTDCGAGTYSPATGSTACIACPTNSNSPSSSSTVAACTCNNGFTGPDGGLTLPADSTNLVAWYKLNGDLTDSTGRTGSLINAGGTLAFAQDVSLNSNLPYYWYAVGSGTSNVNYARTPTINKNVPISFAFWFKTTGSGGYTILSYGDKSVENPSIQFDFNSGQLTVATALSTQWTIVPVVTGLVVNTWYFVVYTLSNANPVSAILYIDGTQRATGTGTAGQTLPRIKDLTVANSGDTGRGFAGHVGDIRIYDKVLVQSEITALFTNFPTPCTACTTGKYKIATGSAACTDCGAATYQSSTGSSVCSACPTNSGASCTACYTSACPCNAGYVGGNFISPYSTTACSRFISLMVWKPSFASVSTRLNAAVGTVPTYSATGGPNGNGHVSFNRANSQFLDAGSRTFNIATNGGFTIVTVVRFTGTVGSWERIIDFGSGPETSNVLLSRDGTSTDLVLYVRNGGIQVVVTRSTGAITQNSWLTVVVRYTTSTKLSSLTVNGVVSTSTGSTELLDRTVSSSFMGKSNWASDAFLNGDIAGLFAVDEFLGTDATAAIVNTIMNGVDMTDTTCPAGNACTACAAGKYKTATGSAGCTDCGAGTYSATAGATSVATCLACPANANSPAGSTAAASCTCNVGFALSNNVCVCALGYQPGV